ncbi:glycosyltransferase family 4 protein [Streptomyces sp. NPDC088387]|uniref:glycosyltransferase family 4 protein n=1 Tax=Streptomyces sp. NPDC088387 TaxID=3365859 RepID=UPI0038285624
MRILTGIDLPWGSPGGSMELLRDLYLDPAGPLSADVFAFPGRDVRALPRADVRGDHPPGVPGPTVLTVPGKELHGPPFWAYVDRLAATLRERFAPDAYAALHLQHLAFGATPALIRAFARLPALALVHGTDLLIARDRATQAEVLREAVRHARTVVVPTTAMADVLRTLTPDMPCRTVHVPWGVPDELLKAPLPSRTPGSTDRLRLLYAGRLDPQKGLGPLLSALEHVPGAELSVAGPPSDLAALGPALSGRLTALGWLPRAELWRTFAAHDALVMPSTRLEAFGLVAVEAQACGLPVLYQPVPGLSQALGDSALPVDLHDAKELGAALAELRADPTILTQLRAAGRRNAARYPLSRTARLLHQLTEEIACVAL